MRVNLIFRAASLLVLLLGAVGAAAAERVVDHATMQRLASLRPGDSIRLDAMPVSPTRNASLRLQRVQIYAPDAHIWLMTRNGMLELPRSNRIFLRGYSDDGSARVAMVLDANATFIEGNGSGAEGSFVFKTKVDAGGTQTFSALPLESTLPAPNAFEFRCANENQNLAISTADSNLAEQLHLAVTQVPTPSPGTAASYRLATIGIDTDSLFMSRLFSNSTTNATNWIAGMFNTMNVMYERDLQVQLLIGTTILRTSAASDPYTGFTSASVSNADLNFFGNYWKNNESSVTRAFAILLSGAIPSTANSCSASGRAWINQYCQNGSVSGGNTVGSYSVTKVCTSINIDPNGSFDARIVGHEIGHNFAAWHTHCTNTSTGAAPTGTNTIDTCFNQETSLGCYAGATSCPAGGSGTIMSYCNFTNVSGCAANTQNQLVFHATQINDVLLPAIAAHTPSCLSSGGDLIFANGFE